MYNWMYWGPMGWIGPIFMLVFWGLVIVGLIYFVRWLAVQTGQGSHKRSDDDSPLEILKRRYARGEIDKAEFEEMKKELY